MRQRAEARFLRALYYYYYMDLFGKAPFKEHFSEELPVEKNRADLFAYIESELDAIENDMYEPGKAPYGRADRAANWLLRARMNLNAEVYTGTAQWGEAAEYATKVIGSLKNLPTKDLRARIHDQEALVPHDGIPAIRVAATRKKEPP